MYNTRFEKEAFKKEVKSNVRHLFRKDIEEASDQELYQAVSCSGKFSSDRTIKEYADEIWNLKPVTVEVKPEDEEIW